MRLLAPSKDGLATQMQQKLAMQEGAGADTQTDASRIADVLDDTLWDEEVMQAKFKALRDDDAGSEARLEFWAGLTERACTSRGLLVVDVDEVERHWFRWRGVQPLALPAVLAELQQRKDLVTEKEMWGMASRPSWVGWGLRKGVAAAGWLLGSIPASFFRPKRGQLVVYNLLEKASREVVSTLQYELHSESDWVFTRKDVEAALERSLPAAAAWGTLKESARLVIAYIVATGEGYTVAADGGEGLVLPQRGSNTDASAVNARRVLQMKLGREALLARLGGLEARIKRCTERARGAINTHNRLGAAREIGTRKLLQNAHGEGMACLSNLEGLLLRVQMAEGSKAFLESLQQGVDALKELQSDILEASNFAALGDALMGASARDGEIRAAMEGMDALGVSDSEVEEEYLAMLADEAPSSPHAAAALAATTGIGRPVNDGVSPCAEGKL